MSRKWRVIRDSLPPETQARIMARVQTTIDSIQRELDAGNEAEATRLAKDVLTKDLLEGLKSG
jgi:hypothetical protein